jgi:hypothetical protein
MNLRLICLGTMAALLLSLTGGAVAAAPNQGNTTMVLKVDNTKVWCKYPVAGKKVEVKSGKTIYVSSSKPIDFVTVKSGTGAYVVSGYFGITSGKITLSKDVSNYVVWTCPPPKQY